MGQLNPAPHGTEPLQILAISGVSNESNALSLPNVAPRGKLTTNLQILWLRKLGFAQNYREVLANSQLPQNLNYEILSPATRYFLQTSPTIESERININNVAQFCYRVGTILVKGGGILILVIGAVGR